MKHIFILGILFSGLLTFSGCKKNEFPEVQTEYSLGQNRGGGVVVYLDASKQHGLIWSDSDLSTGTNWSNAKTLCDEYYTSTYTGDAKYTDWRLPTQEELKNIYAAVDDIEGIYYSSVLHWTSEEVSSTQAIVVSLGTGNNYTYNKTNSTMNVRAVRSF